MYDAPIGVRFFERFGPSVSFVSRPVRYQAAILVLTYISYCCYHMSRRPLTVVKTVLAPNCSQLVPPAGIPALPNRSDTWCAWAPFDVPNPNHLFGLLDSVYLFSYAFFMFLSGFVAERCHLRYFLALGMISSGLCTYAFGLAFYYDIHSIWFFVVVQVLSGLVQTSGWPAVVAAVGNWCPKRSRGIIFGVWNSHTNLGNMLGALIAGWFVDYNWGLSFIVPGAIIAFFGFINFLFLVPCKSPVHRLDHFES
jgi:OPA family glycerol-3-phosphate transporter-like MFS transporter 1/2